MAQSRSDLTKAALIKAAFELFAQKGFDATSTREIANAANTNIASITYHFGGKSGLRIACAEQIVEQMTRLRKDPSALDMPDIIKSAETRFEALALRQAFMILRLEEAEMMVRFLFREAHEQTEAFDYIYQNFFDPIFELLLINFADATGIASEKVYENTTRLTVFSIISQIAYFRIGHPIVTRHLKWQGYTEEEALEVLAVLQINIRAILEHHRISA